MAYSLRLIEDRLAANATAPVSRAPRVLYAVEGALLADGASEPARAVGPGAGRARAAATPARVYRVELVRQPPPPAGGRVLVEHPIDLAGGTGRAGGTTGSCAVTGWTSIRALSRRRTGIRAAASAVSCRAASR